MATYEVRLKSRAEVAEGTMAFRFERPSGFAFRAGQFVNVALMDPPETDDEGDDRTFSIASAPAGPDLVFAARMRDTAFKRVLKAVPMGTPVRITGATGRMVLQDDAARPAVFLAGDIGITPFRSILVRPPMTAPPIACSSSSPTGGPRMPRSLKSSKASNATTRTAGSSAR